MSTPAGIFDREGALLGPATLAPALGARVRDRLTETTARRARRAGDDLAQERLPHAAHFAGSLAIGTGDRLGPRRRAAAGAGLTGDGQSHRDLPAAPEDGFGELEVDPDLGVGARCRTTTPATTARHLAEEGFEDVAQPALEAESARCRTPGLVAEDALGPEAVVAGPLLGVAQDLVGQRHLFELRLGDMRLPGCCPDAALGPGPGRPS